MSMYNMRARIHVLNVYHGPRLVDNGGVYIKAGSFYSSRFGY